MSTLRFEPVIRGRHHVVLRYGVDDLRFATTYWYDDVDFSELAGRYGEEFLRLVDFHLLAFEANKAASLAPTAIDPGPYADLFTDAFWALWETIFHHVWGVWRFDNDRPDYRLPRPPLPGRTTASAPITMHGDGSRLLLLCGGGKDSLASIELLEGAGVEYDTFVYSHSVYGPADRQHELIDRLVARRSPRHQHLGWVVDDAMDAPLTAVYPQLGIRRIVAAETVSSYWTALPVALQHGLAQVALGVTRSTDEHNLIWPVTGERINYLWGMSSAAEQLLHDYVRQHLVADLSMFHLLRPIYDLDVFSLLQDALDDVSSTHSCAKVKPWCCRCAKCIYVWMHYVAWLPPETVAQCFAENLFDAPENRTLLRKMLGLESYKPTDCVGTVSEARLAFCMCRAKGVGGLIGDDIDVGPLRAEATATLEHYTGAAPFGPTFPPALAERLADRLCAQGTVSKAYASGVLQSIPSAQ
ncbi:MAG: hypothetical protein ACR2HP_06585 [Ilumatobacteraceae bacterium]